LSRELKVVHSWTNPAVNGAGAKKSAPKPAINVQLHREGVAWSQSGESASRRSSSPSIELDRAAERIETWLLEWLAARLALEAADVSRDRPFAEFGVDSLTAVELSHELEEQFKVPLPPIVAWNYPTPAALARHLAEQTTGISDPKFPSAGIDQPTAATAVSDDGQLAALLAEVEKLSDAEAAHLLANEQRRSS
jgi:acyl carrier protein